MPCPCGSILCFCKRVCFCCRLFCNCSKCGSLVKKWPHYKLPSVTFWLEDNESYIADVSCTCDKKVSSSQSEAKSNFQTTEWEGSSASSVLPVSEDRCSRCNLPIPLDPVDETQRDSRYCSCPLGELTPANPEIQSEHETSDTSPDHRQVSVDRQSRKKESLKTRTVKSSWQAKNVKDHASNSAEESSSIVTTDTDSAMAEASNPRVESEDEKSNVIGLIPGGVTDDQNLNPDDNKPQRGFSSRAEILADSGSGQADSSAFPGPSSTAVTSVGSPQLNPNVRPKSPLSSAIPNLISDPPAFEGQMCESQIRNRKWEAPHPSIPEEAAAQPEVAIEKYFESVGNELTTSGELPAADTAAKLDRMDKEQSEEDWKKSLCSEALTSSHPVAASEPAASNEDDGKDDIESTTDTDRSTTLSKSHKESASD